MVDDETPEPALAVLHRAREAGFKVSAAQLARWHRSGLVPSPRQHSLGRGKGTQSLYPAGTASQVVALCQMHRTTRSLNDVGWFLWWYGFSVAERYWHERLSEAAAKWDGAIGRMKRHARRLDSEDDEVADQADRDLMRARDARINLKLLRRIRKRVGKDEFPSVLRLVIGLAVGQFKDGPAMATEDRVIDKTLGLDTAREHSLPGTSPWLDGSVRPVLAQLSELLATNRFAAVLKRTPARELHQARDEIRDILLGLRAFARGLQKSFGKNPFGLGVLADISEQAKPTDLAQLTLGWCLLKGAWPGFSENCPPLLAGARAVVSTLQVQRG